MYFGSSLRKDKISIRPAAVKAFTKVVDPSCSATTTISDCPIAAEVDGSLGASDGALVGGRVPSSPPPHAQHINPASKVSVLCWPQEL